jgi:hypothetical protein
VGLLDEHLCTLHQPIHGCTKLIGGSGHEAEARRVQTARRSGALTGRPGMILMVLFYLF